MGASKNRSRHTTAGRYTKSKARRNHDPRFQRPIRQVPGHYRTDADVFTSHQFILKLAEQNQAAYIEALYAYRNVSYRDKVAPFLMVHGILANQLPKLPNLVTQIPGYISSRDIFGDDSTCTQWKKK